ncbi:DUF4249 domain-containing protein [Chryseotalea sanaruensis]|uniref:DUF4249 domain-containing protein n=1 Tax=Chryseotalea sanaruensis TaxID=2482724 RepID=A0A401UCP8_9BACT|nr:DUF4249 domain-containing protein [Chryseotalea sanaruensis]GCC52665.1 DUF4249 domain-containing protein [Chryseotalea sanaruensis]
MTKKVFNILSSLISALLVLSCLPEPLPVDNIPKLETKIVVSSQIIPNTGLVVFVSKSIGALDAGDDSDPESLIEQIAISDALVTLSVDENLDTLENLGNGLYGNIILDWQNNVDYTLTVNTTSLGSVSAVTRLPDFVSFNEVSATIFDNGFDSLAQIAYRLNDPIGENYYMINVQRFRSSQELGNLVNPRIFTKLFDDKEFDGEEKAETFNVLFQEFSEGDSIAVSMANISKAYYDFLKVRSDNRFSFVEFAGEPINYPTNVQGGYGYFNLHTPDIRVFILE